MYARLGVSAELREADFQFPFIGNNRHPDAAPFMCQKTGTVPCRWQGHPGSLIKRAVSALLISRQINKFGSFRNTWRFGTRDAFP